MSFMKLGDSGDEQAGNSEMRSEYVDELTQITHFMQERKLNDCIEFLFTKMSKVIKYELSESNLHTLKQISKFCSAFACQTDF